LTGPPSPGPPRRRSAERLRRVAPAAGRRPPGESSRPRAGAALFSTVLRPSDRRGRPGKPARAVTRQDRRLPRKTNPSSSSSSVHHGGCTIIIMTVMIAHSSSSPIPHDRLGPVADASAAAWLDRQQHPEGFPFLFFGLPSGHAMLSFFQILARAESAFAPPPPAARKEPKSVRRAKAKSSRRAAPLHVRCRLPPPRRAAPRRLPSRLPRSAAPPVAFGGNLFLLFSSPAG
jgi:hypothetical protein